ncbi:hypothetical protein [Streptomyces enissocaesilis]|uniref:Sigma-like protein n=1 Tax=Streptomyces enissocaesilis TaxID=332589 RepID=A0ABN3XG96_9ACTN
MSDAKKTEKITTQDNHAGSEGTGGTVTTLDNHAGSEGTGKDAVTTQDNHAGSEGV